MSVTLRHAPNAGMDHVHNVTPQVARLLEHVMYAYGEALMEEGQGRAGGGGVAGIQGDAATGGGNGGARPRCGPR